MQANHDARHANQDPRQPPRRASAARASVARCVAASLTLVLGVCSALTGCTPVSVTFTFGGGGDTLAETAVMKLPEGSRSVSKPAKIALIDVRGLISDAPRPSLLGAGPSPTDQFVSRLRRAADDPGVRAVVLRLNSPGGTVAGSEVMASELESFRAHTGKPVVVSMGEVSASGAFYLSLAADHVLAQPTTITGSIGVIVPTLNVSGGLARIGIVARSVKSGPNKDIANPLEPMRDPHYAVLQSMVDEFYASFRARVVERRTPHGLDISRVDALTDGRVMTGVQAFEAGLIDELGDVRDAFARAAGLAGLTSASLVKYHAKGASPGSAYAHTTDLAPQAGTNGQPGSLATASVIDAGSLLHAPGAEGATITPGMAYYLWWPAP